MPSSFTRLKVLVQSCSSADFTAKSSSFTAKAALNYLLHFDGRFGGSTITQQLIKNVSSDKRIELHFVQNNLTRVIVCKNSIEHSVLKNNKELRTTKESPELHGMGHQIVETTIKKYNGWIDYFEEDKMFGVQIMLPINDK